ncbi:mechanosensitive ion channel family protein [Sinobacterium caligoides]|nr:mechanosensitive ion channel family protein [Sinobacterium caligoides]
MNELVENEMAYLSEAYNDIIAFAVEYGFQVIGAILILIIGVLIANWISRVLTRFLDSKDIDTTFSRFIANVVRVIVLFCFAIIALGKFGVSITPFVAAIGAIGLGAGLAVQGLLSNYAAGLSIILTRPFKIGDTIVVYGCTGQIVDIKLASTLLETEDKELITIPNRHAVGEVLQNTFEHKMVETTLHISAKDDPRQAIQLIKTCLEEVEDIASEPMAQVGIEAFNEGTLCIGVRCWVPTKRYYQEKFRINLAIYSALKEQGITLAAPQQTVTLANDKH